MSQQQEIMNIKEEERKRKEQEEIEEEYTTMKKGSKIITIEMKKQLNTFYGKRFKCELLYQMTRDGGNKKSMQNKIKGHSNILCIVKTNEDKIFGGYTSCKLEYSGGWKKNSNTFLFSIDLNKKFNIQNVEDAIYDNNNYGICFGYSELVLFNGSECCLSYFGSKNSRYETYGITLEEFCGGKFCCGKFCRGTKRQITYANYFIPIEIEIYEIELTGKEEEKIKERRKNRLKMDFNKMTESEKIKYDIDEQKKNVSEIPLEFTNDVIDINDSNDKVYQCQITNNEIMKESNEIIYEQPPKCDNCNGFMFNDDVVDDNNCWKCRICKKENKITTLQKYCKKCEKTNHFRFENKELICEECNEHLEEKHDKIVDFISFSNKYFIRKKGESNPITVLTLDISGSMSGERIKKAKEALLFIVNEMKNNSPQEKIAIVLFECEQTIFVPTYPEKVIQYGINISELENLSNEYPNIPEIKDSYNEIVNFINSIDTCGGTVIDKSLYISVKLCKNCSRGKVILLTDGEADYDEDLINKIREDSLQSKVTVSIFSFAGCEANISPYSRIVFDTKGFSKQINAESLRNVFKYISDRKPCATDCNYKIISPKYVEIQEFENIVNILMEGQTNTFEFKIDKTELNIGDVITFQIQTKYTDLNQNEILTVSNANIQIGRNNNLIINKSLFISLLLKQCITFSMKKEIKKARESLQQIKGMSFKINSALIQKDETIINEIEEIVNTFENDMTITQIQNDLMFAIMLIDEASITITK